MMSKDMEKTLRIAKVHIAKDLRILKRKTMDMIPTIATIIAMIMILVMEEKEVITVKRVLEVLTVERVLEVLTVERALEVIIAILTAKKEMIMVKRVLEVITVE